MLAAHDDSTRSLAIDAQEQASAAVVETSHIKRTVTRINWVWSVLTFLVVVAGVGYTVRDREDHFETKEAAAADHEDLERQKAEIKAMNARLDGLIETQKRTLDGVDEVKRILMDRRRR